MWCSGIDQIILVITSVCCNSVDVVLDIDQIILVITSVCCNSVDVVFRH